MVRRHEITDEQWERLKPLLPAQKAQKAQTGQPAADHRRILNGTFDKKIYRSRIRVERLINRMKQFRRLATHYDKRAENHRALWIIAATFLWL